ncbi:hypothetical protein KPE71_13970 [Acinetobacter soli]|uniref:hypothetical protein n=1 Tax=Acinetobacter soli TaxID=487316 RepID=UPI001C0DFE67|nr:hypothetical protein [Acinetobacter soli]MBU3121360.1 hypothetical protein [Acinetobacter soli]
MKKPRNKKYNPRQIRLQKVHKFQMFWETNEAKRIIELHHLLKGESCDEETFSPLNVWMKAHKGDLALALKSQTIPAKQSFHIVCRVHAVQDQTGEIVDTEFQLACPQLMTLMEFLSGQSHEGDIYVMDGGFKKRWEGFDEELVKYLNDVGDQTYHIKTIHCCLTCFSTFKSFQHELEFKTLKLMNPEYGLGTPV